MMPECNRLDNNIERHITWSIIQERNPLSILYHPNSLPPDHVLFKDINYMIQNTLLESTFFNSICLDLVLFQTACFVAYSQCMMKLLICEIILKSDKMSFLLFTNYNTVLGVGNEFKIEDPKILQKYGHISFILPSNLQWFNVEPEPSPLRSCLFYIKLRSRETKSIMSMMANVY